MLRPWQTRKHCCGNKCFPVCPRTQHLLLNFLWETFYVHNKCFPVRSRRKQCWLDSRARAWYRVFAASVSRKMFLGLRSKMFYFPLVCSPKTHYEKQQCFRNNISSFATTITLCNAQNISWITLKLFFMTRFSVLRTKIKLFVGEIVYPTLFLTHLVLIQFSRSDGSSLNTSLGLNKSLVSAIEKYKKPMMNKSEVSAVYSP